MTTQQEIGILWNEVLSAGNMPTVEEIVETEIRAGSDIVITVNALDEAHIIHDPLDNFMPVAFHEFLILLNRIVCEVRITVRRLEVGHAWEALSN